MSSEIGLYTMLPFILTYLYISKNNNNDQTIDRLYEYIPDKTKNINDKLNYIIIGITLLLLIMKSENNKSVEHTVKVISYTIMTKLMIYFMTPSIQKKTFSNSIMICLLLNMIYFNVISLCRKHIAYIITIVYSVFQISQRKTTSANIIMDYCISHLMFLLSK